MEQKTATFIELLKYPVLVFSIVLALVILKFTLGLQIGVLTEVSTDGLKFSAENNRATVEALTELETKVNDLSQRLLAMEGGERSPLHSPPPAKIEASSTTQTVSDATASIAKLRTQLPEAKQDALAGWIWIGNYNGSWSKPTLAMLNTGQPLDLKPDQIVVGSEFRVLGNMVIRDGLPPNDDDYYRAQKSLGVVPRDSIVRLVSAPEAIDREFAVQYWAKVSWVK
jgi:hypothetical protein